MLLQMLLGLATCHADYQQAVRLVKWIGFLSEQAGGNMAKERLILSVATTENPEEITDLAKKIFAEVFLLVPPEHEVGWPGSANWMLKSILNLVEKGWSDVLFLEPDAYPIRADWFSQIDGEYRASGKPFMGGYVPTPPPHMTGVGVYPMNWRALVPGLDHVPDSAGWDTYLAEDISAHCHFTPLIQHVFRRHEPGWSIPSLNALDPRAVIFHQDKHGKLISMLDEANYGGECSRHPTFGYLTQNPDTDMTRFYYTANATRAIVTRTKRFLFSPIAAFAGSTPGVYATDIVAEQTALSDIVLNPTSGVTEITQSEYEFRSKKKWVHPVLRTLKPSNATSPQQKLDVKLRLAGPISDTPSRQDAVVVAEASTGAGSDGLQGLGTIKDIGDVLKVESVTPSQPPPVGPKKIRPRIKGVTI